MSWIEIVTDRKIRDALEEGQFDNLPGKGKPLNLDADRGVPPELRVAYRIMRDAQILPDWIQLDKEIRQRQAAWDARVERFEQERLRMAQAKESSRSDQSGQLDIHRERFLEQAALEFCAQNRAIDRLNLVVPGPAQQRLRLRIRELMSGLEERFPLFPARMAGNPPAWEQHVAADEIRPPTQLSNRLPKKTRRDPIG